MRPDIKDVGDAALLKAVADQDQAALEELYRRHAPWLTMRLARRCADPQLVDEVIQDAFVAVWRSAGRFKGRGEPAAWLWGIAIRRLVDAIRRRPTATASLDHVEELSTEYSAEEHVLMAIEHGDLGGALATLSPELRAVIQATVLDGLTTREAARLLGLPAGTVKTRAMRARRELRSALAGGTHG